MSGLGVVGRDRYGVFPLRGKMLNVREASLKQVRPIGIVIIVTRWQLHVSMVNARRVIEIDLYYLLYLDTYV